LLLCRGASREGGKKKKPIRPVPPVRTWQGGRSVGEGITKNKKRNACGRSDTNLGKKEGGETKEEGQSGLYVAKKRKKDRGEAKDGKKKDSEVKVHDGPTAVMCCGGKKKMQALCAAPCGKKRGGGGEKAREKPPVERFKTSRVLGCSGQTIQRNRKT